VLLGAAEGPGLALLVLPLGAAGVGGLAFRSLTGGRRLAVADLAWSAPPVPLVVTPAPVVRPPASEWRIARALGRVEARELLGSGPFGVGLGFCALLLLLFGIIWSPVNPEPWFDLAPQAPWYCYPLVGMTVLGAHRAVTRARRDGTAELLDTCPVADSTRTLGFLLSGIAPVLTLAVFLTIGVIGIAIRSSRVYGSLSARDWADVAAALLLGAGGVALGVALARWLRFSLVPVVAVVAVGFGGGRLSEIGGHEWNPYSILSMAPTIEWDSPVFQARPALWHLLWVVGLIGLVALVAIARDRRDRVVQVLAVVVGAVVVASGIGATRPMSTASAEGIARAISEPASVQECTTTGAVEVCLFPVHRPILRRLLVDLAPVVAVLPTAAGQWTLRQRYDGDLADLPPEVRRRLTEEDLESPVGEIPMELEYDFEYPIGRVSYELALGVVGLPDEAGDDLMPVVAAGQARGVVALWLATRGRDSGDLRDLTTSPLPGSPDAYERGALEEGDCSVPAVVWSAQDLAATRTVVALPEDEVVRVLEAEWDRWVDPRTSTDELLAALGVPGVGPFDHVVARPGDPC
jgi:hypothetical protein